MGWGANDMFHKFTNSGAITNIFSSPLYTALLIVIVFLLIIFFVFRKDVKLKSDSNLSFFIMMMTTAVYTLGSTMLVMYLHHNATKMEYEGKIRNKFESETVRATLNPLETQGAHEELTSGAFNAKIYPDAVSGAKSVRKRAKSEYKRSKSSNTSAVADDDSSSAEVSEETVDKIIDDAISIGDEMSEVVASA